MLVIAGAGTGKTTVLTARVRRLVASGVAPRDILCVTFTRKAAGEMQARLEPLRPEIRTLHAWGHRLIRRYPYPVGLAPHFAVYDETDREDVVRLVAGELGRTATTLRTLWKDEEVRQAYYARLQRSNALDFDGIEDGALGLLRNHAQAQSMWRHRYRHVLIDEYQDTNLAQVAIVDRLAPRNTFVVGDPRQAIYGWRGARVDTILAHARNSDWQVIELTTNYRSCPAVVDAANAMVDGPWEPMTAGRPLVGRVRQRWAAGAQAPAIGDAVEMHLRDWKPGEIAVLGRTWSSLSQVRTELERRGIPHRYYGEAADPWTSSDGVALSRVMRLLASPYDDTLCELAAGWGQVGEAWFDMLEAVALSRRRREPLFHVLAGLHPAWRSLRDVHPGALASETADRVISALGVERRYRELGLVSRVATLGEAVATLGELPWEEFSYWWTDRSLQDRLVLDGDHVHLLTVHGAKGLEWPVVIVADVADGTYPGAQTPDEDLRLFYVALTRARHELEVVCPFWHPVRGTPLLPSPFLRRWPGFGSVADPDVAF